jgi:hypothetical protein
MLLTDDTLVESMREFVTASNRLQYLSRQDHLDLRQLDQAAAKRREAAQALQDALVSRGWRRPGTLEDIA